VAVLHPPIGSNLLGVPDDQQTPARRHPAERRPRLDTVNKLRREIAHLYFLAREGTLDVGAASKLANILWIADRLIEGAEIEHRLSELEERLAKGSTRR
jgi:hypothetical protein